MLRKLRGLSEKILGEDKTNEIIEKTVQEFKEKTIDKEIEKILEETKPKRKKSDK